MTHPLILPTPELVIFDLDGTLVDSVPDLAFSVDEMLRRLGMAEAGEDKVRRWVGNGVGRLVRRALVGAMDGEPDEALFQRALPLFMEIYGANYCRRSRLYPGVEEGLAWLAGRGILLACVTNKAERFTVPLLHALGIRDHFRIVLGGDSLPQKKPNPTPLLHAAATCKVPPNRSLMVGDSVNDVAAARAAGMPVVCLGYGYNHGLDIRTAEPDAVIDSLTELSALLPPPVS